MDTQDNSQQKSLSAEELDMVLEDVYALIESGKVDAEIADQLVTLIDEVRSDPTAANLQVLAEVMGSVAEEASQENILMAAGGLATS